MLLSRLNFVHTFCIILNIRYIDFPIEIDNANNICNIYEQKQD